MRPLELPDSPVPRGSRIFSLFFMKRSTSRASSQATVSRPSEALCVHSRSKFFSAWVRSAQTTQLLFFFVVVVLSSFFTVFVFSEPLVSSPVEPQFLVSSSVVSFGAH